MFLPPRMFSRGNFPKTIKCLAPEYRPIGRYPGVNFLRSLGLCPSSSTRVRPQRVPGRPGKALTSCSWLGGPSAHMTMRGQNRVFNTNRSETVHVDATHARARMDAHAHDKAPLCMPTCRCRGHGGYLQHKARASVSISHIHA